MFADENGDSRVKKNMKIVCSDAVPDPGRHLRRRPLRHRRQLRGRRHRRQRHRHRLARRPRHPRHRHRRRRSIVTDSTGRELRGGAPGADIVAVSTGATLSVYGGTLGMYWVLQHHADPCGDGSCAPIVVGQQLLGPLGRRGLQRRRPAGARAARARRRGRDRRLGRRQRRRRRHRDDDEPLLHRPDAGRALGRQLRRRRHRQPRQRPRTRRPREASPATPATYPDISAPGTNITSACRPYLPICSTGLDTADPNYNTISGTSMAAPHIAGYVAVLQQVAFEQSGQLLSPGRGRGPARRHRPPVRLADLRDRHPQPRQHHRHLVRRRPRTGRRAGSGRAAHRPDRRRAGRGGLPGRRALHRPRGRRDRRARQRVAGGPNAAGPRHHRGLVHHRPGHRRRHLPLDGERPGRDARWARGHRGVLRRELQPRRRRLLPRRHPHRRGRREPSCSASSRPRVRRWPTGCPAPSTRRPTRSP